MSDNTTLNSGTGGDVMRTKDRSGVKTPLFGLDMNPGGTETLSAAGQQVSAASLAVVLASDQAFPRNSTLAASITALDSTGAAPSASGVAATASANSTAFLLLRGGENAVCFQITGTPVGVINNLQFEWSPDTTSSTTGLWYPLFLRRSGNGPGGIGEAPAALTNSIGAYIGAAPLAAGVRLRLQGSGSSGGTFAVNVFSGLSAQDLNASLSAGSSSTTLGAMAISQFSPGTSNAVQDLNNPADFAMTGTGSQTTSGNNILLSVGVGGPGTAGFDTGNARSAFVQVTPASGTVTAGAYIFEESNDQTNWSPAMAEDITVPGFAAGTVTVVASTPRFFAVSLRSRYLRCRISTGLTGTTAGLTAVTYLRSTPYKSAQSILPTTTLADALSVSAVPLVGVVDMVYNGSTFDFSRGNVATTTGDTGAHTSSFAGATQTNRSNKGAIIQFVIGTVSGTTPTMTAQVQISADGTNFANISGAVTASITTGSQVVSLTICPGITTVANSAINGALPRFWRVNYTIGGTTPSFTLTSVNVAYMN